MEAFQRGWIGTLMLCLMTLGVAACSEGSETEGMGEIPQERAQTSERSGSNSSTEILASATEGGWQNVDLLVRSDDPLQAAKNCVQSRSGAISCYAFLTQEAYQAAAPMAAGNFTVTCWAARWTRNKAGSTSGGVNEFMPPACPAAAKPETSEQADDTSIEAPSTEAFELELTVEPEVTDGDQILLQGTTNLPDGTELSTSVSGGGFMGQDEPVVSGVRWRSGPFGPPTGLEPGSYKAGVTLPYGRTQPEMVQAQLGRQMEGLTGPLMKTNPELEFMGQSASVEVIVTVR